MDTAHLVIMGAGAWGTAMAIHLAKCGQHVVLVPRDENKAKQMREKNENIFYLPGIKFPQGLTVDTQFAKYLNRQSIVFIACPTQGLVDCCNRLKPFEENLCHIVSLVKGLDKASLRRPSELVRSFFNAVTFSCLSGPTYAFDFAQGKQAAMVLASQSDVRVLQENISNTCVRVYTSDDVKGVELGGCLKNIYAVGAGILDGLKLGDNAKAAYLTRALREMAVLGTRLGGKQETFYGLSGLGDLIATAGGLWSRNRNFGCAFAEGQSIATLLEGKTVEGYWSVQCFFKIANAMHFDVPILNALHMILYQDVPLKDTIGQLMARSLKKEF